jgi:hypothetical protein
MVVETIRLWPPSNARGTPVEYSTRLQHALFIISHTPFLLLFIYCRQTQCQEATDSTVLTIHRILKWQIIYFALH